MSDLEGPYSFLSVPGAPRARVARRSIPHPAYNGHPTTLKGISRGGCDTVYFRWDVDENGTWDTCGGRGLALASDGTGTVMVKSGATGTLNPLIDVVGYFQ